MTQRPDPRLLAAARLVENLAAKLPAARAHIRAEIRAVDGWGAGAGEVNVKHTAELTPTEQHAHARLELANQLADLEAHAAAIAYIAANACNEADRIVGHHLEAPRCTATGRDGAIEWADATCTAIASRGPLCDRCSRREYRWRADHGLSTRTDGVFSAA
jgi:hypothetical protein